MAKFVNTGEAVDHYYPAGNSESLFVDAGQVVDVGDLPYEEREDCYLVGEGDNVRAWPKSRWELQVPAQTPTRSPRKSDAKEEKPETPAE